MPCFRVRDKFYGKILEKPDSWAYSLNIIAYIQKFLYIGISLLVTDLSVNGNCAVSFQGQRR